MSKTGKQDPTARWPNVFIVGVGKAGTSSLCDYLGQHPDVYVSPVKEPHYFSRADHPLEPAISEEADYLRLFRGARDERVLLEASVSYFWDADSPSAIRAAVPEAKAIVLLREPVARAYSHYWHAVRYGAEPRSFLEAVADELAGRRPPHHGRRVEPYIRRGRYLEALQRFRSVFGPDLLVLLLDDLTARPREVLVRVFEFIGVDPARADSIDLEASNAFALPRNAFAARMLNSPTARRLARRAIPRTLRARTERALMAPNAVRPEIDVEAQRLLEQEYAKERPELERFLGRPLPW